MQVSASASVHVIRRTGTRHRASASLRRCLLVAILCSSFITACAAELPPPHAVQPSLAANCFPQSVFTAAQMRARVDCHPQAYKFELDATTAVLFAFPHPTLDWVGPIFVIHVPSVSEVVLDREGRIMFESYKTPAGQTAIEHVLNNPALMTRILEQAN